MAKDLKGCVVAAWSALGLWSGDLWRLSRARGHCPSGPAAVAEAHEHASKGGNARGCRNTYTETRNQHCHLPDICLVPSSRRSDQRLLRRQWRSQRAGIAHGASNRYSFVIKVRVSAIHKKIGDTTRDHDGHDGKDGRLREWQEGGKKER